MASVTIITQLHCAAAGTIDLPEGKTWGDVTDWYVKCGRAHLTFKGGERAEIDCNPDIGDSIDWKRPIHAEIYANDASGEPDFGVTLDGREGFVMLNVRSFYDCSTAHLPAQTARVIDSGLFAKSPTMQNEYGWLFSVPETLADLPKGVDCDVFKRVMALAMDAGCDYVLFDRDVPPVPYLEVFDW